MLWASKLGIGEACCCSTHTLPTTLHSSVGFGLEHKNIQTPTEALLPAKRHSFLPDQPCPGCCWCLMLKISPHCASFRGGNILLTGYLFSTQIPVFKKAVWTSFLRWPPLPICCSSPKEPKLVPNLPTPCSPSLLQIKTHKPATTEYQLWSTLNHFPPIKTKTNITFHLTRHFQR